nr:DUF305 domain-containing protein [Phenylobacterium soli]
MRRRRSGVRAAADGSQQDERRARHEGHGRLAHGDGRQGLHGVDAEDEHGDDERQGGSVDATFAKKMIAHHEGAIEMARTVLQHGADAQAKQMAQKTIEENTKGIQDLRDWLRQHGG